jgi:transcriptional regulator with XRE-family HTH domain
MSSVRAKKPLSPEELALLYSIGDNIKAARIARGISQPCIAKSVGMTVQSIQNIEAGRHQVGVTTLCKIADILGIPIGKLIYGVIR